MNRKIAILLCIIAGSATIQAIDRKKLLEVMDVTEAEIDDYIKVCKGENGLSDEDVTNLENMLRDDKLSTQEAGKFPKHFGCFLSCIMEKSDFTLDDIIQLDNTFQKTESYEHVMKNEENQQFIDCVQKVKGETNKCDAAVFFTICIVTHVEGIPKGL